MTEGGPFISNSEPGSGHTGPGSANGARSHSNGADHSVSDTPEKQGDPLGEDAEIDLRANPFASPATTSSPARPAAVGESPGPSGVSTIQDVAVDAEPDVEPVKAAAEPDEPRVERDGPDKADVEPAEPGTGDVEPDVAPVAVPVPPPAVVQPRATPEREPLEPGSVARAVMGLAMPALSALLVAALIAVGVFAFARSRSSAADRVGTSLAREWSVQADLDAVWSGLLGLVASGVGQEVATPAEVSKLIGEATANRPGPRPGAAEDDGSLQAAQRSHEAFVTSAASVIGVDDGSPLSVANELAGLSSAHSAASEDLNAYVDSLASARDGLNSESELWSMVSLAVLIAGVVAAGLLTLGSRRKGRSHFDEPARSAVAAVGRVARGDASARSGVTSLAGLGAMAASIDSSLDAIAAELDGWRSRAEWGERSAMVFEALDDAQNEPAAYRVIERALGMIDDDHHPVELMISDRGSNRVRSVANDPGAGPAGHVVVDTNVACLAMRRGQVIVSRSSNSINACPMIQNRPDGACSAVCVPISVGGRPIGAFHMIAPEFMPPGDEVISRLVGLSIQLGNRLGALRTLESSRKEASTDGLTGLPNRRMLQSEVAGLLESDTPFVMVLADLDKFKRLNDNYGHEIGDKALKLFADVLKKNVRGNDLVARIGGEEFVLVYPNMSVKTSIEAIGRLRQALATAVATSRLPAFTCSFGVADSNAGGDGESILRVADAGLLKAKELGGDQAVYAESDLVEEIFGPASERAESDGSDRP